MGVPDGLKDIRVRLCAQDFRPVAAQVASGAGAKETAVGTDYGTEKRDSTIAGYNLRLVGIQREMQMCLQKVFNEYDGSFKPLP